MIPHEKEAGPPGGRTDPLADDQEKGRLFPYSRMHLKSVKETTAGKINHDTNK